MRIEAREGCAHGVWVMRAPRRITGARRAVGKRAGFTLVELLVAMMVFAVGMLGLAATAGSVTRMMGGAKRQTIAAMVAQSRLERIRSSPCSTLLGGTDTVRGIVSAWTVTAVSRGVNVSETVTYRAARNTTHSKTYKTSLSC
jgi:type IV pilus modification protein PilV